MTPMPAPTTEQALRRALSLLAITDRAAFESSYKRVPYVERQPIEDASLAVAAWVRREGLDEALSPIERQRIFGTIGSWTEEERSTSRSSGRLDRSPSSGCTRSAGSPRAATGTRRS
jgi:hypothetical protein